MKTPQETYTSVPVSFSHGGPAPIGSLTLDAMAESNQFYWALPTNHIFDKLFRLISPGDPGNYTDIEVIDQNSEGEFFLKFYPEQRLVRIRGAVSRTIPMNVSDSLLECGIEITTDEKGLWMSFKACNDTRFLIMRRVSVNVELRICENGD